MAQIVSWEYYSSLYSNITTGEFNTAEALAEKEVRNVIGPVRWETITPDTFGYEVLQDCICKVINQMAEDAKAKEDGLAQGIESVSNDGYSVNFAITGAEDLHQELQG